MVSWLHCFESETKQKHHGGGSMWKRRLFTSAWPGKEREREREEERK
jgi:hypothetical protein